MKKIIALIIALVTLVACKDYTHEATIVYKVYYPGNTVTKTFTFNSSDDPGYRLDSYRGSNTLYVEALRNGWFTEFHNLEDTTAPIEVISFTKSKK